MSFKRSSLSLSVAALFAVSATAQAANTTPVEIPGLSKEFTVEQVSKRVFMGRAYANVVIYDLGGSLLLVDSGRPGFLGGNDLGDIRTTINELKAQGKISSTKIKYLINTHWHPDHIGNNDTLGAEKVISGRGGKLRLATPQTIKYFGAALPAFPASFFPTEEVASLKPIAADRVILNYAPYSHTTTDLIVTLLNEKVVIAGDLIIQGWLAFTDNDNGGTMRGLVLSVQRMLDVTPSNFKVIPGHNSVMTKAEAQAWISAIRAGVNYVADRIAEGKTLAQIKEVAVLGADAGGLPAELKALDGPLLPQAAFVELAYRDLKERDGKALASAREIAKLSKISKNRMIKAIKKATVDGKAAAGTEFDTFAFQVTELKGVDSQWDKKVLSEGALAAYGVYDTYVQRARAEGRTDLTDAEYAALLVDLKAL